MTIALAAWAALGWPDAGEGAIRVRQTAGGDRFKGQLWADSGAPDCLLDPKHTVAGGSYRPEAAFQRR